MSKRMMGMVRSGLKQIDLFPTNSFIRYNGQSEYTTSTGGFISLIIIIIFIVLFARMGLLTLNESIIQSSASITNDVNPSMFKIITSPEHNFMFSVNIFGFDLNNPALKLFNITLTQYFYGYAFTLINKTQVPLIPCTWQHYSFMTNQSQFYRMGFNKGLCPPIGHEFTVGGKPTSNLYSEFMIIVDRCNSTVNANCASDAVLAGFLSTLNDFTLIIPVVSMQFNPGNAQYKTVYLQDRNFFTFNLDMGIIGKGSVAQVIIQTDTSIMPFQKIVSQEFSVLPQLISALPYLMTPAKPYAKFAFNKATYTTTYSRSFSKIDTYFSYVGGLIGTIIGFIFILNFYTQKAYQISIGNKLFKNNEGDSIKSNQFNIFQYFKMIIKSFLQLFKCQVNWAKTKQYSDCCQEVGFQLDITYILRKLMFLQTGLDMLFNEHQIEVLYLREKPSLDKVINRRKKHFGLQMIKQRSHQFDLNSKQQAQNELRQKNMVDDLKSPRKQKTSIQELSQNSSIGGLSMSQPVQMEQNVNAALQTVIAEAQNGNPVSQRIIDEVDEQMFPEVKSVKEKNKITIIKVSQIQNSFYKQNLKREPSGLSKREGEDFVFELSR